MGLFDFLRRRQPEPTGNLPAMNLVGGGVEGYPTPPPSDLVADMAAMSQFPWMWACVDTVSSQLAMLPLRAYRPKQGGGMAEVVDHPFHSLMRRPGSSVQSSGLMLRRQVATDWLLSRTGFLVVDQPRRPALLYRYHPATVQPVSDDMMEPRAYQVGDVVTRKVPADQVVHIRGPSWQADAQGVYGTSPVQVLQRLLNAELAIMESMRRQSKLARPEGMVRPPEGGANWGTDQAARMKSWFADWQRGQGGLLVLPFDVRFDPISHAPKDMDYPGGLQRITSATLAAMRVYPTVVGIQSANYATAQQEAVLHWEAREADAAVLDDAWTRIARMFPGCEEDVIQSDFSSIEALQGKRTAALDRVKSWIDVGLTPADACAQEGFAEAAKLLSTPAPKSAEPRADANATQRRHLQAALQLLDTHHGESLDAEQVSTLRSTLRHAAVL